MGSKNDDTESSNIIIQDVDANAFKALLEFIYTVKVPKFKNDNGNGKNDENTIENAEKTKTILVVADQFGCTSLKLYIESILVDKFLVPSKATELLLLADSLS